MLTTYAHEYDAARRRHDESAALAAIYDRGNGYGNAMETTRGNRAQQAAADQPTNLALAREKRNTAP